METLKLFGPPGLFIGVWAVLAAGSIATLIRFPFPTTAPESAPYEQRREAPESEPYVSAVRLQPAERAG